MKKLIQIVGPSFTNYSLARVNRGLAIALQELQSEYEIAVISNRKYAERDPSDTDLKQYPQIAALMRPELDPEGILIYDNFPSDPNGLYGLAEMPAALKIVYIAWEESIFPAHWIAEFNQHAHAVMAMSSFVRDILVRSGLKIPVIVVPCAIDDKIRNSSPEGKYPLQTKKKFKFLHNSSGYPRKGVDILIDAYTQEFSSADDVSLVIKSFPHPLNQTGAALAKITREDKPEIELINSDISDEQMADLYNSVDAGVFPTRAEGFGLPIAELMYKGVPVIVTGYSAHLDFIDENSGFLIDYKLVPATGSQLVNNGAMWAEPDINDLRKYMRELYTNGKSAYQDKILQAQQNVERLVWTNTALIVLQAIPQLIAAPQFKQLKQAVITEINNKSGIADYSAYLHRRIENSFAETVYLANRDVPDLVNPDADNVTRTWVTGEVDFARTLEFLDTYYHADLVHVEYHSTHYKPEALNKLLTELVLRQIPTFLTIHSASTKTADLRPYKDTLNKVARVLVHNQIELDRLQAAGVTNVELFIHGNALAPRLNSHQLKQTLQLINNYPIIATHGLLTDQKGIDQLIKMMPQLLTEFPTALLMLVNAVSSNNVSSSAQFTQYQALAAELNLTDHVLFIPDFLNPEQILTLLQAADVNILAYNDNGEGGSGAVQKLIAIDRPMILTDVPAFQTAQEMASIIPDNNPATIVNAISKLLQSPDEQARQSREKKEYLAKHNWFSKSIELLNIYAEKSI